MSATLESSGWGRFFLVAALFNFTAAFSLLFIPDLLYRMLRIEAKISPDATVFVDSFAVMALVFGLGYWRTAKDPQRHTDIVWLGMIGKPAVVLTIWYHIVFNNGPIGLGVLVGSDLIFATFFALFLYRLRGESRP